MKKINIFFVSLLLVTLIYLLLSWPSDEVAVHFCDVGQGDAILIEYGFWQILVDGGKDSSVMNCLDTNLPFWDKTIELVVVTHADFDHYGGLEEVLRVYTVTSMLIQSQNKDSADFEVFNTAVSRVKENGMTLIELESPQVLAINDLQLSVLWPAIVVRSTDPGRVTESILWDRYQDNPVQEEETNDYSITMQLRYKEFSVLLTGDLGVKGELALISQGLITDTTVLKVGHHGSKTSTSTELMRTLLPEQSVISSGLSNSYGHPHPDVMRTLEESNTTILRTDLQGTVSVYTNGYTYYTKTDK